MKIRTPTGVGAAGRLRVLLDRLMTQKRIKHAVVAVESLDESFRWIGAAGEANPGGAPMREDTPYWIASVTKLYIASAILKLCERKLIDLDDPVSAVLSKTLIDGLHRLDGVDHTGKITVRHLLAHASGLPDYIDDRPKGGRSLIEELGESDRSWTMEETLRIVRETLVPRFPPQPLSAKRWRISYSDTNYQLLIAIVEAVTGRELSNAFEEMLFAPLGLKRTFHPGSPAASAVAPATLWLGEKPLDIPMAMRSFGDLISTADDQLRFMRALVRGQVFEDPATLGLMMGNWNVFDFSLNPARTSPGWPIEYGLGMMRYRIPRLFSPLRSVPEVVGHTGVSGSWLFYCPRRVLLLSGTVDQVTAAAVPFRLVPRLLRAMEAAGRR